MTMPFTAKNPKEIAGLRAGDAIRFDFVVTSEDSWIRKVRPIDAASLHLPAKPDPTPRQSAAHRLREGDSIPAFQLVDQKERAISPETFAGRSLLLTFIFTRCPVPNFCPLLSRNFERLQQEIQQDPALADRVRLLSISFDPEFDTPQTLARYGKAFTEDADFWRFATGEPAEIEKLTRAFSVYVQAEDGTLNHGLCTALVDPDGVITKIWRGNAWRPEEVMAELKAGFTPAPESATDFDADQGARSTSRQD
jgi:protein SCO1/2